MNDTKKNVSFLKKNPRLLFLGVGGVSMCSLAFAAQSFGCKVWGYDAKESKLTEELEAAGIPVCFQFLPSLYEGVDLVVYTAAIRAEDPVLAYPRSLGIPTMSRGAFLGQLMKESKNPVGVAGTHGKSTTTGMLASVFLSDPQRDPTVMAGAEIPSLGGFYRLGRGEDFLFEACEYQNSFLDFFPHLALILNVEHDHADFFPDLEAVIRSFVDFADLAKNGNAIINRDNSGACTVAQRCHAPCFFFSAKEKADLWCENLQESGGFYSFDLHTKEGLYCSVALKVPGEHNVSNALACASAAYLSGLSGEAVKEGLEAFRGVKRRLEYRGLYRGYQVFDDYAHHPDEIRATLSAVKGLGYRKITVVFQPHTYSRTQADWQDFLSSLSMADEVIFADIYAAREAPLAGITAARLAECSENGVYLGDFDAILTALSHRTEENGVLLIMGAGDVVELSERLFPSDHD
jgi:UDP-N-acetylmuramate--alanine ligase